MVCTETQQCFKHIKRCHLQIPTCCFRKQDPWLQSGRCPGWCLTLNPNQIVIVQTLSGSHAVDREGTTALQLPLRKPRQGFPSGNLQPVVLTDLWCKVSGRNPPCPPCCSRVQHSDEKTAGCERLGHRNETVQKGQD